jgi:hypothetical protein
MSVQQFEHDGFNSPNEVEVARFGVQHTPGPWQVVVTEHPHYRGGTHIERRIFTAWDHPQMKGPIGVVNSSVGIGETEGGKAHRFVSMTEADARLIAAAPDLHACVVGFRRKLETYLHVYTGDKELRRLLADCDAAIAKAAG